jgi:hypothetical protein
MLPCTYSNRIQGDTIEWTKTKAEATPKPFNSFSGVHPTTLWFSIIKCIAVQHKTPARAKARTQGKLNILTKRMIRFYKHKQILEKCF